LRSASGNVFPHRCFHTKSSKSGHIHNGRPLQCIIEFIHAGSAIPPKSRKVRDSIKSEDDRNGKGCRKYENKVGVLEKTSSNADLQEAFHALTNSSEIMKQAYDKLLLEHSNLKREDNVVTQRNNQLQSEVDSLKQLKTIVPLQSLANVNNFTVHLEKEIQNTNNMVNKVISDGNARKQDFIALMNVTNVLKTRLSDTQLFVDKKFKDIEIKQN
jgi:hypothetical protein